MLQTDQELLDIALTALSKHNIKIAALEESTVERKEEEKANSEQYAKDLQTVIDRLENLKTHTKKTLTDVMESIPVPADGKTGEQGKQGERGLPGLDGKDGKDGLNGKDGKNGKTPIKGKDYFDGNHGKDGRPGKIGKTGKQGKKGDKGDRGKPGLNGAIGYTPVKGLDYFDGVPGPKGSDASVTKEKVESVLVGEISSHTHPGTASFEGFQNRTEIENQFKVAEASSYAEITYDNGNITNVDIYTDSNKLIKLFSKIIGYNNGNIISVSITDEVNGGTLDKTITYTGSDITSISSTYTA